MSRAVHARRQAEYERERREAGLAAAAQEAAQHQRQLAEFEAGPPDGCHDCWFWVTDYYGVFNWAHVSPPPQGEGMTRANNYTLTCTHGCHAAPPYVHQAVVMAAS